MHGIIAITLVWRLEHEALLSVHNICINQAENGYCQSWCSGPCVGLRTVRSTRIGLCEVTAPLIHRVHVKGINDSTLKSLPSHVTPGRSDPLTLILLSPQ